MLAIPTDQVRVSPARECYSQATAKRAEMEDERQEEARVKAEQETLRRRYEEEHVAVAAEAKAAAVRAGLPLTRFQHLFDRIALPLKNVDGERLRAVSCFKFLLHDVHSRSKPPDVVSSLERIQLHWAQGGRPRPSPAVVGDGVQIFVKPPRRRASAAGDEVPAPDQAAATEPQRPLESDAEPAEAQSASDLQPPPPVLPRLCSRCSTGSHHSRATH